MVISHSFPSTFQSHYVLLVLHKALVFIQCECSFAASWCTSFYDVQTELCHLSLSIDPLPAPLIPLADQPQPTQSVQPFGATTYQTLNPFS